MSRLSRRQVLKGMLHGAVVTVGLPFLDSFLDVNGTALADGRPLPTRFGTWFWGLGTNATLSRPRRFGPGYDIRGELQPIAPIQEHVNVFSNYATATDGRPNFVHHTGAGILRCGQAPIDRETLPSETIDVTIADAIGAGTRFRSLEATATDDRRHSYSARSANAVNLPEVSPVDLYRRVFGPEFQDPNSPDFRPNPEVLLRKSVLSAVREDRATLMRNLGAGDKHRLDEYFTALRGLEERLALQLEKPPPAEACRVPTAPAQGAAGLDVAAVAARHALMTDILVAALACNQTRVFNVIYSWSAATTTKQGQPSTHHTVTHEETRNEQGYQETHAWFVERAMEAWADLVTKLASVREGDRTLLENTLVYAHSEQDNAQMHTIDGIPMMTAGGAGGRIRSGLHLDGANRQATQLGLTMLHAMGVDVRQWGHGSMRTDQVIEEILI